MAANTDLTGDSISATYTQLLHIGDDSGIEATEHYVVDGNGTASALSLGTTAVGIGTSSPQTVAHLEGNTPILRISDANSTSTTEASPHIELYDRNNTAICGKVGFLSTSDTDMSIYNSISGNLKFFTNATEAMRINSSQQLLFDCISLPSGSVKGWGIIPTEVGADVYHASNTTGGDRIYWIYNPNGLIGEIQTTGSTTNFNSLSDYRVKENETAITDGLTRLKQLKPYRFNFKADANETLDGFFAHEVQEVVPHAVSGTKDGLDDDGNEDYQGMDGSKLVPLLVAAVQELSAKVEALENA